MKSIVRNLREGFLHVLDYLKCLTSLALCTRSGTCKSPLSTLGEILVDRTINTVRNVVTTNTSVKNNVFITRNKTKSTDQEKICLLNVPAAD